MKFTSKFGYTAKNYVIQSNLNNVANIGNIFYICKIEGKNIKTPPNELINNDLPTKEKNLYLLPYANLKKTAMRICEGFISHLAVLITTVKNGKEKVGYTYTKFDLAKTSFKAVLSPLFATPTHLPTKEETSNVLSPYSYKGVLSTLLCKVPYRYPIRFFYMFEWLHTISIPIAKGKVFEFYVGINNENIAFAPANLPGLPIPKLPFIINSEQETFAPIKTSPLPLQPLESEPFTNEIDLAQPAKEKSISHSLPHENVLSTKDKEPAPLPLELLTKEKSALNLELSTMDKEPVTLDLVPSNNVIQPLESEPVTPANEYVCKMFDDNFKKYAHLIWQSKSYINRTLEESNALENNLVPLVNGNGVTVYLTKEKYDSISKKRALKLKNQVPSICEYAENNEMTIAKLGVYSMDNRAKGNKNHLNVMGMVLLGGAPNAGKTPFLVQSAIETAKSGHEVFIFCTELGILGMFAKILQKLGLLQGIKDEFGDFIHDSDILSRPKQFISFVRNKMNDTHKSILQNITLYDYDLAKQFILQNENEIESNDVVRTVGRLSFDKLGRYVKEYEQEMTEFNGKETKVVCYFDSANYISLGSDYEEIDSMQATRIVIRGLNHLKTKYNITTISILWQSKQGLRTHNDMSSFSGFVDTEYLADLIMFVRRDEMESPDFRIIDVKKNRYGQQFEHKVNFYYPTYTYSDINTLNNNALQPKNSPFNSQKENVLQPQNYFPNSNNNDISSQLNNFYSNENSI